jgi:LuxR family transcriptional regulator, maltose regulon positive regulatory protein
VGTSTKAISTPAGRVRPPELPFSVIERTRLLDRVSQAVDEFRFTLISAPAGSGKTVLASAWARHRGRTRAVWLTLTSRDDQPVVFWSHVRFALADIGAMSAEAGPGMAPDRVDVGDIDAVAEQIVQLDRAVVLVLDAADRLQHGTVFDQLGQLLDSMGGRLRVLMTTRVDPPMPLHLYRLEGTLAEIRLDELAFTSAEVQAALDLDEATALDAMTKQVLDRTEGWAAGVRLAALALMAHEDAAALDGLAADYLRAEVLDKLADSDRDFLVRISLADEMTPGLGAVIAERADADELLRRLSHGNTFVLPVRGRPGWYRIHPLFRELLSAQLARTPDAVIHDLRRRAADWFGAHGQLVPAVCHAAAIGDWVSAAAFVIGGLGVGDLMLPTPEGRVLAGHLSAMPDLDSADVQLVRAALAVGQGDLGPAHTCLARCGAGASASADWLLSSAVVAARLSDRAGAPANALTAARDARAGLASLDHRPDARLHVLDAIVSSAEGTAQLRAGDLDAACSALGDAVRSAAAGESDELRLRCLATLALAEVCRGHLSRGQGLADSAERLAEQCAVAGTRRPAATHLAHAWVALERQDLIRAQRSLDRAGRLDETGDDALMSSVSSLLRAQLMRDRGDAAGARCILENPDRQIGWLRRYVDAEAAGVGLLASVAELEPRRHRAGPPRDSSRRRLPVETTSQRVQELLERAQIQCVAGDVRAGRPEVAKALSLARRERIRRPFAHMPAQIRAIIRNDHALRSHAGWLRPEQTGTRHTAAANDPAPVLEDLSERELEVLRHLSALLTTEEIAAEMFISVNTVKTHVRKIFVKLSVSRRNDAVRRAWELNLV